MPKKIHDDKNIKIIKGSLNITEWIAEVGNEVTSPLLLPSLLDYIFS